MTPTFPRGGVSSLGHMVDYICLTSFRGLVVIGHGQGKKNLAKKVTFRDLFLKRKLGDIGMIG